ncbi:MAG: primosomal protein N', partial [Clostridia bacterium]|nr:primosomal protein N' [Clostridia bacterium]
LLLFLKERCFCTVFDILRTMLPAGVRYSLEDRLVPGDPPARPLTAVEQRVLKAVADGEAASLRKAAEAAGRGGSEAAARLLAEGLLRPELTRVGMAEQTLRQTASLAVSPELAEAYLATAPANQRDKHSRVISQLQRGELPVAALCYMTGVTRSVVSTLEKRGIVAVTLKERLHLPYESKRQTESGTAPIHLSEEQRQAADGVFALLQKREPAVALLHGVTGSGKTLCYLSLIDRILQEGGGAIVLVPEIVLTPQLTDRFFGRYGDKVAVLHSGLSAGERRDEWRRIRRGDCPVVVGTRSAVFAPVRNLRLIVMDEEQESAYKSESTPRYHARTVAKFRAAREKAVLLLCSATPSVESYAAARQGRYHLFTLSKRYSHLGLPAVTVTHLRDELSAGVSPVTGPTLTEALRRTLAAGRQSILFLNRRGYHTFLGCRHCGEVLHCENCSISMTYHQVNGLLMCHYCGSTRERPILCPSCKMPTLTSHGFGTQRVEEELHRLFPEARILRMDMDTTSTKMSHEEMLLRFSRGEYDILLGTQMVTKGLDLPNVALVGVLFADSLLFQDDYRAAERAFSLLTQVVGRAGRAETPGEAIIESFVPDNRVIQLARQQDYIRFYENEIAFRHAAAYPPYCDIYQIICSADDPGTAQQAAEFFAKILRMHFETERNHSIILFPAMQAPVFQINGKYRYRILLKCRDSAFIRRALHETLCALQEEKSCRSASCSIDLNPYSMN